VSDALRAVLASGTPAERVEAAWELAMLLGGEAVAPLRAHVTREPSAGARRHVIVVLAGLGEREAVRALAEHDPDAHVRATACRYVTVTATPDDDEASWLAQRLRSDPTDLLACVVADVGPSSNAALSEVIDCLQLHPVREVREALVARYERLGAPRSVVERALGERDPELRRRLAALALAYDVDVLGRIDLETARALLSQVDAVPYEAVVAFARRGALRRDDAELALARLETQAATPPDLLLQLARSSGASFTTMDHVLDRCADVARSVEVQRELALCRARWEPWLDPDPDDSYPPSPEYVASVRQLVARIDSLLSS
jgi:hypothetical protein